MKIHSGTITNYKCETLLEFKAYIYPFFEQKIFFEIFQTIWALLHKYFETRTVLNYLDLSDNSGVRLT